MGLLINIWNWKIERSRVEFVKDKYKMLYVPHAKNIAHKTMGGFDKNFFCINRCDDQKNENFWHYTNS